MPTAIDVPQLIGALSAATETFPHEKRIAAITFGACLHFPEDHWQIVRARTFATCAVVRALYRKKITPSNGNPEEDVRELAARFLQPHQVTELVLDHDPDEHLSFDTTYDGNFPDLGTAEAVAFFLLACPAELKPSLNKAVFFLEKDGFNGKGAFKYAKSGRTTTKAAWARFGSVSCFTLAQSLTKVGFDFLAPDAQDVVSQADKQLSNPDFGKFFPTAKALQQQLASKLSAGAKGHPLWEVPQTVVPGNVELPTLNKRQIDIIQKYQAPAPY